MFNQSVLLFEEALNSFIKIRDRGHLGRIHNNLALAKSFINENEAIQHLNFAFEINSKLDRKLELGKTYLSQSLINAFNGNLNESIMAVDEAVAIFYDIDYISGLGSAYHYKSKILFKFGKFDNSIEAINKSNKILLSRDKLCDPYYLIKNEILKSIIMKSELDMNYFEKGRAIQLVVNPIIQTEDYISRYKANILKYFKPNI